MAKEVINRKFNLETDGEVLLHADIFPPDTPYCAGDLETQLLEAEELLVIASQLSSEAPELSSRVFLDGINRLRAVNHAIDTGRWPEFAPLRPAALRIPDVVGLLDLPWDAPSSAHFLREQLVSIADRVSADHRGVR